jgi:hypothetical protein
MSKTVGQLSKDIQEIADWIEAVRAVMKRFQPATCSTPGFNWQPPPVATPAPIASPKCLRPKGDQNPITEADLIEVLRVLRDWTDSVAETLDRMPPGTQIP